jgi:hypothetical protein
LGRLRGGSEQGAGSREQGAGRREKGEGRREQCEVGSGQWAVSIADDGGATISKWMNLKSAVDEGVALIKALCDRWFECFY